MKIFLVITIFLLVGAFFIISERGIILSESKGMEEFGDAYISWLDEIFGNSKDLAGYVVKFDWLPDSKK